ncbi:MAG: hypothetical protein RLZZ621_2471 [Gemmatimonadota bacterium]
MTIAAVESPVRWTMDGSILVVTIDNPPVNALGLTVRAGLMDAIEVLGQTSTLHGMVLRSTGSVFIGGADIREFTGPRREPLLRAVCDRLEASTKPIVAAMHGAALGGGFEIALATHYRVAAPAVEVAFPEVLLGLLPGAGGTQRAPRLCGAALALDMMLTGRRVPAADAIAAGLIDAMSTDPFDAAMQWVRQQAAAPTTPRRSCDGQALRDIASQQSSITAARSRLSEAYPDLAAPPQIIACVEAAINRPFHEGLAVESAAFLHCLASPQRAALVHLFFAERDVRASVAAGVDLPALGAALAASVPPGVTSASEVGCAAMAEAGRALLASGAARAAIDIDVASVRHAGFPRHRGGVLYDATQREALHHAP